MKRWFENDPSRLARERAQIAALAAPGGFIKSCSWLIDSATDSLCLNFEMEAQGEIYALVMFYPATFPTSPPHIRPSNATERLSSHQYLNGTLCLEWGPDNWHSQLGGADMVESAHKLLTIENPRSGDPQPIAPSRHQLTVGQETRFERNRVYLEQGLRTILESLSDGSIGRFSYLELPLGAASTLFITSATIGEIAWTSTVVPDGLGERVCSLKQSGIILRTLRSSAAFAAISTTAELEAATKLTFPNADVEFSENRYGIALETKPNSFFIIAGDGQLLLSTAPASPERLVQYKVCTDATETAFRGAVPTAATKRIGIVGLGSIGSKMAVSFARAGFSQFVLVDDDLLFPANLVRHNSDWADVCQHKVNAVAAAIGRISPHPQVTTHLGNLAGQESNSYLAMVLHDLGRCDLIIDATASSSVFNVLSGVVATYLKPLVWCQVFAGGIGGLIARSRPGVDPSPQYMRAALQNYTSKYAPATDSVAAPAGYTATFADGTVQVATDADISVIASNATRLALDTLRPPAESEFPVSMYLIGLAKSWLFQAPFDAIPFDVGPCEAAAVAHDVPYDHEAFLQSLLAPSEAAPAAAA